MRFTSKLIKQAWQIRRKAAVKFSCKIMLISWKECIAMAKETSLPNLIGSEKQIIWAEQIRKEWIESLDEEIKDGDMDDFDMNDVTRLKAEILDAKVYAECWINNSADIYLMLENNKSVDVLIGKNNWKKIA